MKSSSIRERASPSQPLIFTPVDPSESTQSIPKVLADFLPPGPAPADLADLQVPAWSTFRDESAGSFDESCTFRIAGVYQDVLTRESAMRMSDSVAQKVGAEHVQDTWHDVRSLDDPQILVEAVRTAIAADVIVVSIHAADELPPNLYAWIDSWLPRRKSRAGALAALITVAVQPSFWAVRTQEYLRAVASRGQLDFVTHECSLSGVLRASSPE